MIVQTTVECRMFGGRGTGQWPQASTDLCSGGWQPVQKLVLTSNYETACGVSNQGVTQDFRPGHLQSLYATGKEAVRQ